MAKKKKGRAEQPSIPGAAVTAPNIQAGQIVGDATSAVPQLAGAAGQANIAGGRQETSLGLNFLRTRGVAEANPQAWKNFQDRMGRLQDRLAAAKTPAQRQRLRTQIDRVRKNFYSTTKTADQIIREADPGLYSNLDRAQQIAGTIGQTTPEGQRYLDAAARGYTAGTIGSQNVTAAQMGPIANVGAQQVQASRMGDFGTATSRDITAGQVGDGQLGQSLMQRAIAGVERGGLLSPQATRDAIQSARQGFAARGLATGNSALGAELLNRDRYARQREMEDLQFAGGVQAQDIGRQFQNVGNQLNADQANQSAALQAELANLQARYNAAVQNGNWEQAAAISNQEATLRADMSNQQTAFNTGQFNTQQANVVGISNADRALNAATANENAQRLGTVTNNEILGNAASYQDALKSQGLGASLQLAGAQSSANPLFRAAALNFYGNRGLGTTTLAPASSIATSAADMNSRVNMFNADAQNNQMWNAYNAQNYNYWAPRFMSAQGGGNATGGTIGSIAGGLIGGAAGYFAGVGNPMFAMGGYSAGSQIGGAVGGGFR